MSEDNSPQNHPLLAPLHQFRERSLALLELAHKGDWQAFEEDLAEREAGLSALQDNQFVIDIAKAGLEDQAREYLAEIQKLNDDITHIAEQGKAEISKQLKESQKAQKGINEYRAGKP